MPLWFLCSLLSCQAQPHPPASTEEFTTDFTRHGVPYDEILSGGPPKDGIPSLDAPIFESVMSADGWMESRQPVILLRLGDEARAYPIRIVVWHEIVNDIIQGKPVIVTYCPLCNTAIAFDRTLDRDTLEFGTTGRLRFSNMVMYDRQTESWWQQATGEGIAGRHTGRQLTLLPVSIISWEAFRNEFPNGKVLSRQTGHDRDYDRIPYTGYDEPENVPFLYQGPPTPATLPALARVLALELNGAAAAYPYETIERMGTINDTVGGTPVVIFWQSGTLSPFDQGKSIGSALAFHRKLDDRLLDFGMENGAIIDRQTRSRWSPLGVANKGPLAGKRLAPTMAVNHFWFSWAAFRPSARLFRR